MTNISREDAVAVLTALGLTTASKRPNNLLESMINRVDTLVSDYTLIEDEDIASVLANCLATLGNNDVIKVTEG